MLPRFDPQTARRCGFAHAVEHRRREIAQRHIVAEAGEVQAGVSGATRDIENARTLRQRDPRQRGRNVRGVRENVTGAVVCALPCELLLRRALHRVEVHAFDYGSHSPAQSNARRTIRGASTNQRALRHTPAERPRSMKTFLKILACLVLVAALVAVASGVREALGGSGNFSVTLNGEEVKGFPKFVVGSAGVAIGLGATLFALAITAVAILGSSFIVFAVFALIGVILTAVAIPFLLPFAIPIVLIVALVLAFRNSKPGTTT